MVKIRCIQTEAANGPECRHRILASGFIPPLIRRTAPLYTLDRSPGYGTHLRGPQGGAMKLKKFDVVDFLDSDEALVEYLNAALAENDPKLRQGARQRSTRQSRMSSISDVSGVGRQSLYRALSTRRQPPDRYTVQSPGSPEHPACHRGEQLTAPYSSLSDDRKTSSHVLAAGTFSSWIRAGRRPTVSSRGASNSLNKRAGIADVSIRREPACL